MRITSQSFSNSVLQTLNRNNERLLAVQNQISNQQRILKPSDDPVASARLTQLRREQSATSQYQSNIQRLSGNLSTQEGAVKGCEQQLLIIKDTLEAAMDGTLSADDIAGYGEELASMLEATVALINSRDEDGDYLFSGTKIGQQSAVFDEGSQRWSYRGNDDTASTQVANGQDVRLTTALALAFGDDLTTLNILQDVAAKMQDRSLDPADRFSDMQAAFKAVEQSHAQVGALYTDLGGRQNTLNLLKDVHDDHSAATQTVIDNLQGMDAVGMARASIELNGLYNATLAAQKSYTKIQQLSLFSLI